MPYTPTCGQLGHGRKLNTGREVAQPWNSRQTQSVNLAVIAAFTAAALSLIGVIINVVWTYRLSRRTQLEQWRRNEERPIVARLLTLSDSAADKWLDGGYARGEWLNSLADSDRASEDTKAKETFYEQWDAGSALCEKFEFEIAQLDLIAGKYSEVL
jgi:hypothetical protein